jgi:hypothetical protein
LSWKPAEMMTLCSALDRGFGKPTQAIDLVMLGRKISELSTAELIELNARLSTGVASDAEQPEAEVVH